MAFVKKTAAALKGVPPWMFMADVAEQRACGDETLRPRMNRTDFILKMRHGNSINGKKTSPQRNKKREKVSVSGQGQGAQESAAWA
jgi:hypothetical protein